MRDRAGVDFIMCLQLAAELLAQFQQAGIVDIFGMPGLSRLAGCRNDMRRGGEIWLAGREDSAVGGRRLIVGRGTEPDI